MAIQIYLDSQRKVVVRNWGYTIGIHRLLLLVLILGMVTLMGIQVQIQNFYLKHLRWLCLKMATLRQVV